MSVVNLSRWMQRLLAMMATTQVLGTEATGTVEFRLPALATDTAQCLLPSSPFNNPAWVF